MPLTSKNGTVIENITVNASLEVGDIPLTDLPRINPAIRAVSRFWLRLIRPWLLRRVQRPCIEYVDHVPLLILPDVLNAVIFRGGAFLARTVSQSGIAEPPRSSPVPRALDMGTGSGVGAIFAARRGYRVIGIDINPEAVKCARINAHLNGLEDRIDIREGDLYTPLAGERFDLVLFNPPYYRGEPKNLFDMAWRAADVMERFAAGLPERLTPDGHALILLSTDGDAAGMLSALRTNGFHVEPVARRHFGNEIMTVYSARLR